MLSNHHRVRLVRLALTFLGMSLKIKIGRLSWPVHKSYTTLAELLLDVLRHVFKTIALLKDEAPTQYTLGLVPVHNSVQSTNGANFVDEDTPPYHDEPTTVLNGRICRRQDDLSNVSHEF
ncbi:hypothetical protein Trydic_g15150 [Trypoxylus dichotomus]